MKKILFALGTLIYIASFLGCSTWQKPREEKTQVAWDEDRERFLLHADDRYNILAHEHEQLKNSARSLKGAQKEPAQNLLDELTDRLLETKQEINDVRYTDANDYIQERREAEEKLNSLEVKYIHTRSALR